MMTPAPPPSGGGVSEGDNASTPLARGICAIFRPDRPSVTGRLLRTRMGNEVIIPPGGTRQVPLTKETRVPNEGERPHGRGGPQFVNAGPDA